MPVGYTYTPGAADDISVARVRLAITDVTDAETAILSDIEIAADIARYGFAMGICALASTLSKRFGQELTAVGIGGALSATWAARAGAWGPLSKAFDAHFTRLATASVDTAPPVTMPPLRRARIAYADVYSGSRDAEAAS